jgi:hypothetical protein
MSSPETNYRLKGDVRAMTDGRDPLVDPLTHEQQQWLDQYMQKNPKLKREEVEHGLRLDILRVAQMTGTTPAIIKGVETVEIDRYRSYPEGTPEHERPVRVKNSQGLTGWTTLGNLRGV